MIEFQKKLGSHLKKTLEAFSPNQEKILYGIPNGAKTFFTSALHLQFPKNPLVIILPTNSIAEDYYRELKSFVNADRLIYLSGPEHIPYEYSRYQVELKRERILALNQLVHSKEYILVASLSGVLKRTIPKSKLLEFSLHLEIREEHSLSVIQKNLIDLGYHREETCEQFGTFSVKGDILDVFSPYLSDPIRIEFFGDEIESIKTFDPYTQKSKTPLKEAAILPSDEFILTEEEKEKYHALLESHRGQKRTPDEHYILEDLLGEIRKEESILPIFPKSSFFLFPERNEVKEKLFQLKREFSTLYEKKKSEMILLDPDTIFCFSELEDLLSSSEPIELSSLPPSMESEPKFFFRSAPNFKGKIRDSRGKIREILEADPTNAILLTSSFDAQAKRIQNLFEEEKLVYVENPKEEIEIIPSAKERFRLLLSDLKEGFECEAWGLYVWTENNLFGRTYKRKTRFKKQSSNAIQSFIDLKEGDYIVHVNHGVGKFVKIERTKVEGKERDFLLLSYHGGDTLFVPLDQISLVQRYVGGTDSPRLDSLGKSTWKKTKEKVQEAIDKLAEDLVKLYSSRLSAKGYQYPKDSIWQEEFEADFEFEETPDQMITIDAVKADLESEKPMDRLVCGDVGYGKTEVAIRAAFKVMMAGRQVLFLCPTTVLALQHYNTLVERYKNYPIKIGLVSRFRTSSEIKKSIEDFGKGDLDLLVGTHAILTPKMKPKNLGLLIIDEEQKFGVTHKEAIKKLKTLVDVLTLSATPIPRTLHMALTGIRDLSIIATPPKNRQNVDTYVTEENDDLVVHAVEEELKRGGQVFYIHNRVDTIEQETQYLQSILPKVSIAILHGQMEEDDIEEILLDFYNKKYDILVTTTIIESGIDMPNVNTLLVKRADTFGLSQLYQIRGRVGRSEKKAYAYFFYPKGKVITEQAEKRLNTIYEYQELGSGFKVAMRDLEIRGAGNLLGKEQSGDIAEIGFELYISLLEDAIAKAKGEKVEIEIRTLLSLPVTFYIPETYIPDTKQKIEFYKRLEGASEISEIEDIQAEMEDRFGKPTKEVETFLLMEKIRAVASGLGLESIFETGGEIRLKVSSNYRGDGDTVIQLIQKRVGLSLSPKEPNILRYKPYSEVEEERLQEILALLQNLQASPSKKR